jgi:hypothetical protein
MTDDILARIAECIGTQRDLRNVRTVGVLEAAQARIAALEAEVELLGDSAEQVKELEAERDKFRYALTQAANDTRSVRDRFFAERNRAEKAEAEAHHWKLAEGAERDLRLRADQRIRQLEAERC